MLKLVRHILNSNILSHPDAPLAQFPCGPDPFRYSESSALDLLQNSFRKYLRNRRQQEIEKRKTGDYDSNST